MVYPIGEIPFEGLGEEPSIPRRPDFEAFDEEEWLRKEMGRIYKQARLMWERLGEIQPFDTYLMQTLPDVAGWFARQEYERGMLTGYTGGYKGKYRIPTYEPYKESFSDWLLGAKPELAKTLFPEMFKYQPRYQRGFQAVEEMMGMSSREWDWIERNYGDLLTEFKTTLPTWVGLRTEKQAMKIEQTWAGWLKEKVPEVKEEFHKLSPWERGERPSYMAPRIKTVQW